MDMASENVVPDVTTATSLILAQLSQLSARMDGRLAQLELNLMTRLDALEARLTGLESTVERSPSKKRLSEPRHKRSGRRLQKSASVALQINEAGEVRDMLLPTPKSSKPIEIPPEKLDSIVLVQLLFKRATVRFLVRSIEIKSIKRDHIAREIHETEANYVKQLQITKKEFLDPLRKRLADGSPILSREDIKVLFGDVEVILGINSMLLSLIESKLKNWNRYSTLGDVFANIADGLKAYFGYIENYENAHKTLKRCLAENKEFSVLVNTVQKLPELNMNDLESMLIQPVQRLPRYKLLLQELFKNTWDTHPDYADLTRALTKISGVTEYVNNKKKEAESTRKLIEIQHQLIGSPDTVVAEYRRVIADSIMHEVHDKTDYRIFLFNDALLFTIPEDGKFRFKQMCHIENVSVRMGASIGNSLSLSAFSTLYNFACKSVKVKQKWVEDFNLTRKEFEDKLPNVVNPKKFGTMIVRSQRSDPVIVPRSGSAGFTLTKSTRTSNLRAIFEQQDSERSGSAPSLVPPKIRECPPADSDSEDSTFGSSSPVSPTSSPSKSRRRASEKRRKRLDSAQ